jgi:hypothetical protein
MTIESMMQSRAVLDAQIEATLIGESINEAFDAKWTLERTILSCTALTLTDVKHQLRILARRAADGADVSADLARLAV